MVHIKRIAVKIKNNGSRSNNGKEEMEERNVEDRVRRRSLEVMDMFV